MTATSAVRLGIGIALAALFTWLLLRQLDLSQVIDTFKAATGRWVIAALAAFALVGIAYALSLRLFTNIWVEGWTALMIAVLFIGGVQLISIGILGEYIGRIYNEIKRRPLYVVEEYLGFEDARPAKSRSPVVEIR